MSDVNEEHSSLADWTDEEIDLSRRWVQTWQEAGRELERLRREELRNLDVLHAIGLLCGDADYHQAPRRPRPTSGLVEQQYWFRKAAGRESSDTGCR